MSGKIVAKAIAAVLPAVIVCGGTFAAGSILQLQKNISSSDSAIALMQSDNPDNDVAELPDDFYMLLLGVDSSENRQTGDEASLYNGSFRSDTMIVAHVNVPDKKVSFCSLERDIETKDITGHEGETLKLNAAYAIGGIDEARDEAEELVGVTIPYYAVVDMDGLTEIVDSIGGIDVDVEKPFYDNMLFDGIDKAGVQHLNGQKATLYARSRYPWENGDFDRARHQRDVIKAIAKKAANSDIVSLYDLAETVSTKIATNMTVSQIYTLADKMKDMDFDSIISLMTPTTSEDINGESFQVLNENEWNSIREAFKNNEEPKSSEKTAQEIIDSAYDDENDDGWMDADSDQDGKVSSDELTQWKKDHSLSSSSNSSVSD